MFDRALMARHEYDRDMAGFRRDCRASGTARCVIHELHPEIVGEALVARTSSGQALDQPGRRLPAVLRRGLPLLARDPAFPAVAAALAWLYRVGVVCRALRPQVLVARTLGTLETQRGVAAWQRNGESRREARTAL